MGNELTSIDPNNLNFNALLDLPFLYRLYKIAEPLLFRDPDIYEVKKDDRGHSLQIAGIVPKLIKNQEIDPLVVMTAAITHDIGWSILEDELIKDFYKEKKERKSELRKIHEKISVDISEAIMQRLNIKEYLIKIKGYTPEKAETFVKQVLNTIDGHDSKIELDTLEQKCLREADRIGRYTGEMIKRDLRNFDHTLLDKLNKFEGYQNDTDYVYSASANELKTGLHSLFIEYLKIIGIHNENSPKKENLSHHEIVEDHEQRFSVTKWDEFVKPVLNYNWISRNFQKKGNLHKLEWLLRQIDTGFSESADYILLLSQDQESEAYQSMINEVFSNMKIPKSVIEIKLFREIHKAEQYKQVHAPVYSVIANSSELSDLRIRLEYALKSHLKKSRTDAINSRKKIHDTVQKLEQSLEIILTNPQKTLKDNYEPEAKILIKLVADFLDKSKRDHPIINLGGVSNKILFFPGDYYSSDEIAKDTNDIIIKICKNNDKAKLHAMGWREIRKYFEKINPALEAPPYLDTGSVYSENIVIQRPVYLIGFDKVIDSIGKSNYILPANKDLILFSIISKFHADIHKLNQVNPFIEDILIREGIRQTKLDYQSKLIESLEKIITHSTINGQFSQEYSNFALHIGDFLNGYSTTPCWDAWPENLGFEADILLKSMRENEIINNDEYLLLTSKLSYTEEYSDEIMDYILNKFNLSENPEKINKFIKSLSDGRKIFDPDKLATKSIPNDSFIQLRVYRTNKYIDFSLSDFMKDFTSVIPESDKKRLIRFGVFYYAARRLFYEIKDHNLAYNNNENINTKLHSISYYAQHAKNTLIKIYSEKDDLHVHVPSGLNEIFNRYQEIARVKLIKESSP